MRQSTFSVSRFRNRNGVYSWRVDGRLNGVRVRRNFKTQEEAAAEKAVLGLKALQLASGLHAVTTWLTVDQLREAEVIFRRLGDHGHSPLVLIEYALAHYRAPAHQKPLAEAIIAFVQSKEHEREQDLLSEAYLIRMKRDLDRLQKHFPAAMVSDLTAPKLLDYLEARRAAVKTFNNRRGIVSTLLKFALQRDWIAENPLAKVPPRRIRRRRSGAVTLTAAQAEGLMAFVEDNHPAAVPFFALCLFAGIRPCLRTGEILRLRAEHVRLDQGAIRIDGEVSKVREPRTVSIQPNLALWLNAYPLKSFPIIPRNLQHIRERAVEKFDLSHDVMRHTFISMFVAKFRSMGEAALQAGNSESIIRKHYLDLKSKEEAEQFFSIAPRRAASEAEPAPSAATPAPKAFRAAVDQAA